MKSGIYTITNMVNGKIYIGYAINFNKRKANHWSSLNRNEHRNIHIQRAWKEYGEESFSFDILEECEELFLASQENYWCKMLDAHNPEYGYNIASTHPDDKSRHSEETIERMRKIWKDKIENGYKMPKPNYGPDMYKKMVETRKSNGKLWHSVETREKQRIANTGKIPTNVYIPNADDKKRISKCIKDAHERGCYNIHKIGIIQLNLKGEFIKEWECAKDIQRELKYEASQITACCKGKWGQARGYKWLYKEEYEKGIIISTSKRIFNKDKIIQLTKCGTFIKQWSSQKEASINMNINAGYINRCCVGVEKSAKGYKWMYAEEYYKQ